MNKTLTISLVAALGVVGGGAYMLMDSDKNFSEYVPEPVTALIGDYLPSNFKTEQQDIVETQISGIVEDTAEVVEDYADAQDSVQMEEVQQSAPQIEETLEVVEENNTQQIENNYDPAPQQTVEQSAEQNDLKQGDDNVVDLAMKEIQESLNEVSNQVEVTSNNPKAKIIEEKIVAVSNKISKLDMENKKLEEKFQNVLRENRELAKQLHDIDQQLTQSN
jgi:hypothetical protein